MSEAPEPLSEAPAVTAPTPGETPPPTVFDIRLNALALSDPFRWLAAGWRDFRRASGIGLFYGGCFTAMGWLLLKVFKYSPAWTLALSAGFLGLLVVGPVLGHATWHAYLAAAKRKRKPTEGAAERRLGLVRPRVAAAHGRTRAAVTGPRAPVA